MMAFPVKKRENGLSDVRASPHSGAKGSRGGLGVSSPFKIIGQNKTLVHAKERELLRLDRSERVRYERVNEASSPSAQKARVGVWGLRPHLE